MWALAWIQELSWVDCSPWRNHHWFAPLWFHSKTWTIFPTAKATVKDTSEHVISSPFHEDLQNNLTSNNVMPGDFPGPRGWGAGCGWQAGTMAQNNFFCFMQSTSQNYTSMFFSVNQTLLQVAALQESLQNQGKSEDRQILVVLHVEFRLFLNFPDLPQCLHKLQLSSPGPGYASGPPGAI